MAVFINGASIISPQKTFGENVFPGDVNLPGTSGRLTCVEPAYREFLDPMASRRMSRIVKMGVCSALKCLKDTGISNPDAIITGTGMGCLEDTEKFLASIYENEEKLLNPTPFIQSTHNTVAGAIALAIKCHNYNSTYTQRGLSFENALADAIIMLSDDPSKNVLAGGFDELTPGVYQITGRMGLWRNSTPGEGVAFFMLSGIKDDLCLARLVGLSTFHNPGGTGNIKEKIRGFLQQNNTPVSAIDLVVHGKNGHHKTDSVYNEILSDLFKGKANIGFKELCGEYDTCPAFALWLSAVILKSGSLPAYFSPSQPGIKTEKILIYNTSRFSDHSLFLLEKC